MTDKRLGFLAATAASLTTRAIACEDDETRHDLHERAQNAHEELADAFSGLGQPEKAAFHNRLALFHKAQGPDGSDD